MGSGKTQGGYTLGTTGSVCLFTCDTVSGWNVSNFADRTAAVNGGSPTTISDGVNQAALTKKNGYNYWIISAGRYSFASMSWWGSYGGTCNPPASGF